jgi:hypothetical protein
MTPIVLAMMGTGAPSLSPLFLAQQAAALTTGALAACAALGSVVPGYRAPWRTLLLGSAAAWLFLLLAGMGRDWRLLGSLGLTAETDWPCVALMTIGGALLSAPLVGMLRRGAPFTPRSTAFLGGLGALSVASIEACLARPHAYTATMVVWHGATVAVLAAALAWSGGTLLGRSRPSRPAAS